MLKKHVVGAFAICMTATCMSAVAAPDIKADDNGSAYLQDSRGVVVRSSGGLCWRTGPWTASDALPGCDGELLPPVMKPTAPPLVATAPPAPVPKQTPAPVGLPKRCDFTVTIGNDEAFGFDKVTLNNAARKKIDELVIPRLKSCPRVELIVITGHTDRLGAPQYNLRLSEKRADAVAVYLKSNGVTAEIDTLGAGETRSIKSCTERRLPRSKLIRCLEPNRRVVIEVRGTKP